MIDSPLYYFTDAVLRGPTVGCMLMCLAAALVGVIVFLRKQSLLGESLSHAAYPGVVIGVMLAGALALTDSADMEIAFLILLGAFVSSFIGLWVIRYLQSSLKIRPDSALCFVLSGFFGIGIALASHVQFSHPGLYRQIQAYLFGQAATMGDIHILIYGILSFIVVITIAIFYKEIQTILFNSEYASSLNIRVDLIDSCISFLTVLSVVIGIRSVGVVLMSAMLIAPAAAARQYTNKFHYMLILAAIFGILSAFFGNYFSVELTQYLALQYSSEYISLPTGPMIVLVASAICIFSLLFSPERGLVLRLVRIARFRYKCMQENLLKEIWRYGIGKNVSFEHMVEYQEVSRTYLRLIVASLVNNGWLDKTGPNTYRMTHDGEKWAAQIVRLHRLWEVYLADYLGVGAERVHRNAEEMEHIITPELERELTILLKDPQMDPHHQKIPKREIL